jgi:DNA-binding NarL/FixJ family response regulator
VLRIVLADDHEVVRQGLRALLEGTLGCSIVGEAATGQAAIALTQQHRPDVLVVDLVMPDISGLQVIRRVNVDVPPTRMVVLSMHANEAHVREALREGATAYVLKESPADEFIAAILAAAAGRRYLSPPLTDHAIAAYTVERYLQEAWQDGMRIVSTTATVEVPDVAAAVHPQVVLVELSTPQVESLNLISRLRMAVPEARIIALSWGVGEAERAQAIAAGAVECLVKAKLDTELLNAVARAPGAAGAPGIDR